MNTTDLAHKRPIEVRYRRRVARRYGDPLPDLAFAVAFFAGAAVGTRLAVQLIVH